eukprot:scaffold175702_cov30-Prasinocladus_malaysianus.AAC.1
MMRTWPVDRKGVEKSRTSRPSSEIMMGPRPTSPLPSEIMLTMPVVCWSTWASSSPVSVKLRSTRREAVRYTSIEPAEHFNAKTFARWIEVYIMELPERKTQYGFYACHHNSMCETPRLK